MEKKRDVMELEDNKEALESFIESYMKLEKKFERPKNIFSIIKCPKEAKFQYALEYFLNPKEPHGFKDEVLKAFLDLISEKEGEYHGELSSRIKGHHVELQTEVGIHVVEDDDGRIDLIIAGGPSSRDDPEWALFVELKVGASEGEEQTQRYAHAGSWNFSWFGKDTLHVKDLDVCHYIYIKKGDESQARSKDFVSLSWRDLVNAFKNRLDRGMFDYPHRSVIQFLDFLRSLKDVENMGDESKKKELELVSDRLRLYFEQKELIEKVEEANRQFQQDFNELSEHLHETWESKIKEIYDFSGSRWETSPSSGKYGYRYENIRPKYWIQKPLDGDNILKLFFFHPVTQESLREKTLHFYLRIPTHRKAHLETNEFEKNFNNLFCAQLKSNRERLRDSLKDVKGVEFSFERAGQVLEKRYDLEMKDLYNSYISNLKKAYSDFCENEELIKIVNDCFEEAFREAFGKEPEGEKAGALKRKR